MIREHELKCWPEFFAVLLSGEKSFEIRKDDRGFRVGDVLWLREWRRLTVEPVTGEYTGREIRRRVTYILSGIGLQPEHVCMGLADADAATIAQLRAFVEKQWESHMEYGPHCDRLPECETCQQFQAALGTVPHA